MKHVFIRRIGEIAASLGCELLKPLKISFIVGSKWAFFSLSQCTFPLIGKFGGTQGSLSAFTIRTLYAFLTGFSFFASILYHVPSLCGALYLSTKSKFIRIALPLICIALFVAHPVGKSAFPYALYWLIPLAVPFLPQRLFFIEALGTTFTMHAVGSVIWLYTRTLDGATWNSLISVVWAERLVFAFSMTVLYYAISYACTVYLNRKRYTLGIRGLYGRLFG